MATGRAELIQQFEKLVFLFSLIKSEWFLFLNYILILIQLLIYDQPIKTQLSNKLNRFKYTFFKNFFKQNDFQIIIIIIHWSKLAVIIFVSS